MNGGYGYLIKENLENNNATPERRSIDPEQKITPDLPLEDVMRKFEEHEYLFVFSGDKLEGLITYADLNKAPVRVVFYIWISRFEVTLRKILEKRYESDTDWLKKLSEKNQREIGGIYISEKAKGVETSLLDCTMLTHLKEIIEKDEELRDAYIDNICGPDSNLGAKKKKEIISRRITPVINLRNAIMHSRTLINRKEDARKLYGYIEQIKEDINLIY